jgi:hypothetical protein
VSCNAPVAPPHAHVTTGARAHSASVAGGPLPRPVGVLRRAEPYSIVPAQGGEGPHGAREGASTRTRSTSETLPCSVAASAGSSARSRGMRCRNARVGFAGHFGTANTSATW